MLTSHLWGCWFGWFLRGVWVNPRSLLVGRLHIFGKLWNYGELPFIRHFLLRDELKDLVFVKVVKLVLKGFRLKILSWVLDVGLEMELRILNLVHRVLLIKRYFCHLLVHSIFCDSLSELSIVIDILVRGRPFRPPIRFWRSHISKFKFLFFPSKHWRP